MQRRQSSSRLLKRRPHKKRVSLQQKSPLCFCKRASHFCNRGRALIESTEGTFTKKRYVFVMTLYGVVRMSSYLKLKQKTLFVRYQVEATPNLVGMYTCWRPTATSKNSLGPNIQHTFIKVQVFTTRPRLRDSNYKIADYKRTEDLSWNTTRAHVFSTLVAISQSSLYK